MNTIVHDIKVGNVRIVTMRNRQVAFQVSYAVRWKANMPGCDVWIDCPTCDLSLGMRDENGPIDDATFVRLVREQKWVFIPNKHIACPECLAKEKENE